jgi:hypothetical protein
LGWSGREPHRDPAALDAGVAGGSVPPRRALRTSMTRFGITGNLARSFSKSRGWGGAEVACTALDVVSVTSSGFGIALAVSLCLQRRPSDRFCLDKARRQAVHIVNIKLYIVKHIFTNKRKDSKDRCKEEEGSRKMEGPQPLVNQVAINEEADNREDRRERREAGAATAPMSLAGDIVAEEEGEQELFCCICFEGDSFVLTPCFHLFCRPCISRWIELSGSCPMCRKELRELHLVVVAGTASTSTSNW